MKHYLKKKKKESVSLSHVGAVFADWRWGCPEGGDGVRAWLCSQVSGNVMRCDGQDPTLVPHPTEDSTVRDKRDRPREGTGIGPMPGN